MCVMMILYEECNTCRIMPQACKNFARGIVKFSCLRLHSLDYVHAFKQPDERNLWMRYIILLLCEGLCKEFKNHK